jgi:type VI secretion system protein ImpB
MAKDEASHAPKEMVNIRLPSPEPGAQGEELPFRMAVVGDFKGKSDETPIAERDMFSVNPKNFDEVMGSMDLNINITVPNKIGGKEDEEIPVDLKFSEIKSFRPEEVAKQVPQIKDLVDLRKKLIELRSLAAKDPQALKELTNIFAELGKKE